MKVKELIAQLQLVDDQDLEVIIFDTEEQEFDTIESVIASKPEDDHCSFDVYKDLKYIGTTATSKFVELNRFKRA